MNMAYLQTNPAAGVRADLPVRTERGDPSAGNRQGFHLRMGRVQSYDPAVFQDQIGGINMRQSHGCDYESAITQFA